MGSVSPAQLPKFIRDTGGTRQMRQRMVISLAWLLMCGVLPASLASVAGAVDPPIRANYLERRKMKAGWSHSFQLSLVNEQAHPVWFIMPSAREWRSFPEKVVFLAEGFIEPPFSGRQFESYSGFAVEVSMYGDPSFKAFRLPGRGRLELESYAIKTSEHATEILVLTARDLKVNGKTPLNEWLPYNTLCGKNARIDPELASFREKNLDRAENTFEERTDYPSERVKEVDAEEVSRWSIKLPWQRAGVHGSRCEVVQASRPASMPASAPTSTPER